MALLSSILNTITFPSIVNISSTIPAVSITQTGTGNALVVEDSGSPDATPFIVDFAGGVIQGYGTFLPTDNYAGNSMVPNFQKHGGAISSASIASTLWNSGSGSNAGGLVLSRSKSATIGTNASVVANDTLGTVSFNGDDGTSFISSAYISGAVDGTPGTNVMPGRLVFATTPAGASAPTERMRIDSAGQVSIGTSAAAAGTTFRLSKNITGAATAQAVNANGAIQSDVTGGAQIFRSSPLTQATTFTLGSLDHFQVNPQAFGAGSTVTNQYGFNVASSLTGATNNYGFYGNIAAGTGRYNLYMAGTAQNYFAGATSFGSTLTITGTTTLATALGGVLKATAGVVSAATAGTDYQSPIGTISGLVKGNGANTLTAAIAGTDYIAINGALGTPSSGTVTNLTGTASININGTVGATTASTGRFTTITSTIATGSAPLVIASTTNVANLNASSLNGATFATPGIIGSTTAAAGNFTALTATGVTALNGGLNMSYANASIELGSSTVNTPYIDFHSSANSIDYDVRLIASGGNSVVGKGTLSIIGLLNCSASINATTTISDAAGDVRSIPQNAKTAAYVLVATDNGKHISITTGGVTVPASVFSVGNAVTIFNNSAAAQTITQGASVTLYNAGDGTSGNRTLGARGLATILCVASNVFTITGAGLT